MRVIYMSICPKCADFKIQSRCLYCNIDTIKTDISLQEAMKMTDKQEEELINHYIKTLIKDTYDPKIREDREAIDKAEAARLRPVQKPRPKCPTCQSTNISKIGILDTAASITLWGIFSNKINKSFECKDCGYTW